MITIRILTLLFIFMTASLAAAPRTALKLSVTPRNPLLFGKGARQPLVVVVHYSNGTEEEVTSRAGFEPDKKTIATVDRQGMVYAQSNGAARIRVTYQGLEAGTVALVQRAVAPLPLSFAGDVLPVLTKVGCNGGNCHGALNGQNGFKLSLFGYEPSADYEMIAQKHEGRRLNLVEPENSLLLLKPSFQVAHGGGQVLSQGSSEYKTLLDWIRAGARQLPEEERRMVSIRVLPEGSILYGRNAKRQLLVTARYSDGTEGDVTHLVKFQSNDENTVSVDRDGIVTALRGGETAILVRGPGVAAASKVGVVSENRQVPQLQANNFIDQHVFAKLKSLQLPPSEVVDDASFLRRASLDIIGLIPSSEEVRRFLADTDPNKRSKWVDELLKRPEYADFWAVYWGDRLLNSIQLLYELGPQNFSRYLHDVFRKNTPYDKFVRSLLTSSGSLYDFTRGANYYPFVKKPEDMAASTSQLFLGIRIECAHCHNHPFERWTQNDFRGMAAFFPQPRQKRSGLRHNEYFLYLDFQAQFQDSETKQVYLPKPLDGPTLTPAEWTDRRELLADWMTSPDNPFFARTLVNRMWKSFMGRGLVEPVDDFRLTNPPTNEPLLEALAQDFVKHGYDLHHLIRRITLSRSYQLSSIANEGNREDQIAYSRYYTRHLAAEQLLDSVSQATDVPQDFDFLYPGTRAVQVAYPEFESYFLDVFDRPPRKEVCERRFNLTLNQVMHRISGDTIHGKITAGDSILAKMLAARKEPGEIIEELYLRTVSRYPTPKERGRAETAIARSGDPRHGLEDLFWALLNSKEFLYNH